LPGRRLGAWLRATLAGLLLTAVAPAAGLAWGDVGHAAVAEIAVGHLSDRARSEIERLLPGGLSEFVAVASWADHISETWPESYAWHSVEIPHHSSGYDRERDCRNDDCIVERIKLFAADVGDRRLATEKRVVALKMVIHLVGDLHVPLHAYLPDRSWDGWEGPWIQIGDTVDVLHYWWDDHLVFDIGPDAQEIAQNLGAAITVDEVDTWTGSGPETWANESYFLARDFVVRHGLLDVARWITYTEDYPMVMPEHVREETRAIIARRLAMAGVRLAWLLNRAFE